MRLGDRPGGRIEAPGRVPENCIVPGRGSEAEADGHRAQTKEVFCVKLKKLLSILLLLAMLAGLAPAVATAYAEGETAKVKGLRFTGEGYTEKEGIYSPDFKEKEASFKGEAAPEKAYKLQVSSFFTDSKCKKPLKTEPAEGETYYFRVGLKTEKGYSLDLSGVKAKTCTVKLEGFELKYKKVQKTQDSVSLLYTATLLPPEDAAEGEDPSSPAAPQDDGEAEAPQNDGEGEAPQDDSADKASQNDGEDETAQNDEGSAAPQEEPAADEPREVTHYKVWIGDTEITSDNLEGTGWSFAPDSSTLTLDNPTISGNHPTTWNYSALICSEIDLVITGKASITASGSNEMVLFCDQSLTFRSCDLSLTSTSGYCVMTHRGNINVESGTLRATGKENGIFSFESVSISGGTVTGKGEKKSGIKAQYGTLSISGGTVEGTGYYGIQSTFNTLSITGGSVKAVGTRYAGLSGYEVTVGNGVTRLEAQGVVNEYDDDFGAFRASTKITIGDRLAFVEPEGGSVDNDSEYKCIRDDKGNAAEHVVLEPGCLITFEDWDGTQLQSGMVAKGKVPSYTGEEPVRDEDAQYTYSFKGWKDEGGKEYGKDESLPAVKGDATYTAVYTQTPKAYTITFKNGDEVLQSGLVEYGKAPSYTGATPTKEMDEDYTYSFKGWKDEDGAEYATDALPAVKGDATYTAVYEATPRIFTVTVKDDGHGTGEASPTEGPKGTQVTLKATPKKGYEFKEWKVISGGVTISGNSFTIGGEDVVVKAVFQAVSYKVTAGSGAIWTKGSNKDVSITVKRSPDDSVCFSHFTGVQIDGKDLAAGDYEAKAGSTVVTLKAATLEKLSTGKHSVTVVFDDGSAKTSITLKVGTGSGNGSAVRTGDVSTGIWFALLGGSILGLGGIAAAAVIWRRRRNNEAE